MCICGSGKKTPDRLRIGGQEVGILELDSVLKAAIDAPGSSDEEIEAILMRELKRYNYVPASMEREYREALWKEHLKRKERSKA